MTVHAGRPLSPAAQAMSREKFTRALAWPVPESQGQTFVSLAGQGRQRQGSGLCQNGSCPLLGDALWQEGAALRLVRVDGRWGEGSTGGAETSQLYAAGSQGTSVPTLSSATIYLLSLFDQAPSLFTVDSMKG